MIKIEKTKHGTCTGCGVNAGDSGLPLTRLSCSTDGNGWSSVFLCTNCLHILYSKLGDVIGDDGE